MKPKISVVIPVYNVERFLRKCLDSVTGQPMRELEIICVNDGSTDSSPQILDEYAELDSRITVIHQPNSRAGAARNRGLEAATGEYIHFLDSDDYLADNVYEEIYQIAHENRLEWLLLKGIAIDVLTEELVTGGVADSLVQHFMAPEDYERPFSFAEAAERLTARPAYPPWCSLYLREFLMENQIRFDTLQQFDDHYFHFAAAARAQRIMAADVYAVYHRTNNPDSLAGGHVKHFAKHFESFRTIREDCRFLTRDLYALVLRAELDSIFYWYNKAKSQNVNFEEAHQAMCAFIQTFDLDLVKDVPGGAWWILNYAIIMTRTGMLSESAKIELVRTCAKMFFLPLNQIPPGSRIALVGASLMARSVYDALECLLRCEIVKWVEWAHNWDDWCKNNPLITEPDDVINAEFDYIFLAITEPQIASDVSRWLVKRKGVSEEKIVSVLSRDKKL